MFLMLRKHIILITAIALTFFSCTEKPPIEEIQATHPQIKYTGRIDSTNSGSVKFSWSGVSIETMFEGTSIGIYLKDGNNDYNVFIDEKFHIILSTTSDSVYILADSLADTLHYFLMTKRTEAALGIAEFGGFILDEGKSLFPTKYNSKRKIEFIGDSFVAGFGNEGLSPDCPFSRETENNYFAYGPILARRLNAEYNVEAISGIGVVRNYGDSNAVSARPFPSYFDLIHYYADSVKWDFQNWQPDAVIVRLGRNDFWSEPFPKREVFRSAYKKFIEAIRNAYPEADIFCLCGPVGKGLHCNYINSVVGEFSLKNKDKKIHFVKLDIKLNKPEDFGCQLHPNIKGHNKIADFLEPIIRREMGWQKENKLSQKRKTIF